MIRRLLFRGPAPAAARMETEAEAQRAFRLALDEARCERIAELEALNATLRRNLALAGLFTWYWRGVAEQARRADGRAAHRYDDITEVLSR